MASESTGQHRAAAAEAPVSKAVSCAVLTVSDTRTPDTDTGGARIASLLEGAGHRVIERRIARDEPKAIRGAIEGWATGGRVQAVLTTGGTGISRRDTTIEVVRGMLAAELPGFGELFRMLSWQEVGAAAMLSRAVAGLLAGGAGPGVLIFSMPGSPNAIEVAMTKLIVPELSHLVWERGR